MQIPAMTHPLSKNWRQPTRESVHLFDDKAFIDRGDFNILPEYSCTIPTGVYEGKMWKRREGVEWLICWYGPSLDPDECRIHYRKLVIVDIVFA